MTLDFATLTQFAGRSLSRPKQVVTDLIALRLGLRDLWLMFGLIIVLSVITMTLTISFLPQSGASPFAILSPFALTLSLGGMLAILVVSFAICGRMLGGTGTVSSALITLTWWQGMSMVIQLIQIFALLVSPVLAAFLSMAGFGWMLVALILATDAMHEFDNLFKALGTVILGFIIPVVAVSTLLAVLGVSLVGVAP